MPLVSELSGLWRRSLIEWPDGRRDTTSKVLWLQGLGAFGDLRQPAGLTEFRHARRLADLSREDCERLCEQQAFAGDLTFDGEFFEWDRLIDFQPKGAFADVGSLAWDQDVLIETGRDVHYIEHWHRDRALKTDAPIADVQWKNKRTGVTAILVRSGTQLMYARDRNIALPKGCSSLSECLAQADGLAQAHALVDCEISLAAAVANHFLIYASTLPFRVGEVLEKPASDEWDVKKREGATAALDMH
jgi:hypothetical protein